MAGSLELGDLKFNDDNRMGDEDDGNGDAAGKAEVMKDEDDEDEGEPISDADFKPLQVWAQLGKIPRKAYLLMVAFQVCTGVLFFVTPQVSTTAPLQGDGDATSSFLRFEYDVPMFVRSNLQQSRQDALNAGMRDADSSLGMPQVQLRQSVSGGFADLRDQRLEMELVYLPTAGDVFRRGTLEEIWNIEKRIVRNPKYQEFCLRDWGSAEREVQHRQLSVGDEAARITAVEDTRRLNDAPPPCAPPVTLLWACNPNAGGVNKSCAERVLDHEAWPPGLLHCDVNSPGYTAKYGCTPAEMKLDHALSGELRNVTVNSTYREFVVTQYAGVTLTNTSTAATRASVARFYASTSELFGRKGSTVSRALRSRFRFALPLRGYDNADDRRNEQLRLVRDYLWNEITNGKNGVRGGEPTMEVSVTYTGFGQEDMYVEQQCMRDLALLFASRVIDFAVIMFAIRDTLFALAATFDMFIAVGMGYVLLFSLFNDMYFGLVSVAVIAMSFSTFRTISLSIGDAWCQSAAHQGSVSTSFVHRISYTWVRSSKGVALTCATLFACFVSMSFSILPAMALVGRFGLAMTLVFAVSSLTSLHTSLLASQAFFPWQDFWVSIVAAKFQTTYAELKLRLFPIESPADLKRKRRRLAAARAAGAEEGDLHKLTEEELDALEQEFAEAAEEADEAERGGGDGGEGFGPSEDGEGGELGEQEDDEDDDEETSSALRVLEEFFNQYFSPAVLQYRVVILCVSVCLIVLHAMFMQVVNWDNPMYHRLNPNVPFRRIGVLKEEHFPLRTRIEEGLRVRLVSGLEPGNPIDRRGALYDIAEAVGSPRWLEEQTSKWSGDPNDVDNRRPAELDALWLHRYNWTNGVSSLGCFKRLCELAEVKNEERFTAGGSIYDTTCWTRRFSEWAEETKGKTGSRSRVLAEAYRMPFNIYANLGWKDVERDKSLLYPMLYDWLRSQSPADPATTEYDKWKTYIWGSRIGWDHNAPAPVDYTLRSQPPPSPRTSTSPITAPPPPPAPPPLRNPANDTLFTSSIRLTFAELPIIGDISLPYAEGIELERRWETWHADTLRATAECGSEEVKRASGFQTASRPGWAYFETQRELMYEKNILPILVMLTMALGSAAVLWNWWMALLVVGMGALNQILAYGFMGMVGWNVGMVEGITVLALPAVSVDFVCQVAQGYMDAAADVDTDQSMEDQQADRVVMALTYSGVTVIESLVTHLLAAAPMFLSRIEPTFRSNAIIYYITMASAASSLFLFPILLSFVGPVGSFGSLNFFYTIPQKKQQLLEEERRLLRARTGGGAHFRRRGILAAFIARLLGAGGGGKAKKIEPM